jgi:predicted amidohydrolase YtcJ
MSPSAQVVLLVVLHAHVWTGNPARPWAEAVAVSGERILAVGSDREIRALTGPSTRVVDGRGGMLTPGFNDSHIHLSSFDRSHPLPPIFMQFLRDRSEAADRIAAYAAQLPMGAWILGESWTDALWKGSPPDRKWLDALAPDHPVWLVNTADDAGLANTAALRAAGLDATPSQPGALIRGAEMWRVDAAVAERSAARDDAAVERFTAALARAGVTSVQHNNSWYDLLILQRLRRAGRLRVRVYAAPSLPGWRRLADYVAKYGRGDSWLHWGALKGYGAINAEQWYPWISGASRAGLQVMTHLGSETEMRTLLGLYDRVRREQNLADPRFRIEHGHDFPAGLIPVMVRAGVIASWQPALLAQVDQRTAAGQPRPKNLFPCHSLLAAGVKIAFGTDAGSPDFPRPLESVQMALERVAPDGTRLTLDEALRAFTADAAYAEFAEKEKGTLEPGRLADFVLFDSDFSRVPVSRIHEARPWMVVIGGKVVAEI